MKPFPNFKTANTSFFVGKTSRTMAALSVLMQTSDVDHTGGLGVRVGRSRSIGFQRWDRFPLNDNANPKLLEKLSPI
jgi:hypothetical protein